MLKVGVKNFGPIREGSVTLAHLNPDNQRKLAWAIVKLIRGGVHLLITTHSDYFVQQITNFILLSRGSGAERVNLKYSQDDYLRVDEVGAYLFKFDKKDQRRGSVVKELEVTEGDGIPEDQFVEVAEAIYDETIRLERLGAKPSWTSTNTYVRSFCLPLGIQAMKRVVICG